MTKCENEPHPQWYPRIAVRHDEEKPHVSFLTNVTAAHIVISHNHRSYWVSFCMEL